MAAQVLLATGLWSIGQPLLVAAQSGSTFGILEEVNPPITDFSSVSLLRESYSTWFDGCGRQACGCGIPPELLKDNNGKTVYHVALNVQNTAIYAPHLQRPVPASQAGEMGLWENGKNCGRWVEITFQEDCLGLGLTASDPPDVCGVNPFFENPLDQPEYKTDGRSGAKMYAVVADSCQDGNLWCRNDVFHLDLQAALVRDFCGDGSTSCFNSRHLKWRFMDSRPSESESGLALPGGIQFAWFCSSNFPWHSMLVVYNLKNGVAMVTANGYDASVSNGDAGQQWVLDRRSFSSSSQPFQEALTIEVIDRDGHGAGVEYYLLLDTNVFHADCDSGLNASPAPVLDGLPVIAEPPEVIRDVCNEPRPVLEQCGGQNWDGDTCCEEGSECVVQNQFYSQCLPIEPGPDDPPAPPPEPQEPPTPPPEPQEPPTPPPEPQDPPTPPPEPQEPPAPPPEPQEPPTPPPEPQEPPTPPPEPQEPPAPPPEPQDPPPAGPCQDRWAQCGGANWDGPTCCKEGATCTVQNNWYSQCL